MWNFPKLEGEREFYIKKINFNSKATRSHSLDAFSFYVRALSNLLSFQCLHFWAFKRDYHHQPLNQFILSMFSFTFSFNTSKHRWIYRPNASIRLLWFRLFSIRKSIRFSFTILLLEILNGNLFSSFNFDEFNTNSFWNCRFLYLSIWEYRCTLNIGINLVDG